MKKFILTSIFLIAFLGCFFSSTSRASAATLYFHGGSNWNTVGNWWTDAGFTTPAGSLPTIGDDVIVASYLESNSGPNPSINSLTSSYGLPPMTITVANGATFNGGEKYGNIIGDVTFNSSSTNHLYGTVTGNAIFNNSSQNLGYVTGNAIFNNSSSFGFNRGTVGGTATFNSASGGTITIPTGKTWEGTAGSNVGIDSVPITSWIFNGNSYNKSNIIGTATFNDTSFNYFGKTITGDATFNDTSYNAGTVTGTATYNYASGGMLTIPDGENWSGSAGGSIVGSDTNPITSWIFNSGTANAGVVPGNATFHGTGANYGTVNGNAIFYDTSINGYGCIIGLDATFNDASYNAGTVTGNAIYNYAHAGVINIPTNGRWTTGTAGANVGDDLVPISSWIFNGNSWNEGTITGDATFNDISFNGGSVTGTAIFNYAHAGVATIADGGYWGSGTAGSIVGDDALPITSWVFNGASGSNSTLDGDATFNGTSYNGGTVTGDAIFNDSSVNYGTVDGDALFAQDAVNYGTVTGTITYSDPTPRTLYFHSTSDYDWNNLNNWWKDSDFSIQATRLPTSIDDVISDSGIGVNNGDPASVNTFTLNGSGDTGIWIPITVANGATFFNGYMQEDGQIIGDAEFFDLACMCTVGTIGVTGNAVFHDTSHNHGIVAGTATFYDESHNHGTVTGNATFYDTTNNFETVEGDAYFNDVASGNAGDVGGTATFTYTTDTLTNISFIAGAHSVVVADGASVNIFNSAYNSNTIFQTPNHGSFDHSETFLGYESFDTEPSPSSLGYLSTTTNFNKALNIDETYWNTSGESIFDSQIVKIKSNLAHITNPKFTTSWTGHADTDATVHLSIFNFSKNTWEELTSSVCNTDCTLTGEKTGTKYKDSSDFSLIWIKSKYINTDQISLSVSQVSTGGGGGGGGGGGSNPTPNPATIPTTPITTPVVTNPTDCLQGYKFSPSTGKPCSTTITPPEPLMPIVPPSCAITTTLKQGSLGAEVKCLQTKLNITSDGSFGPKTKLSVMNFQKLHLLTPDGVVGVKTRTAVLQ